MSRITTSTSNKPSLAADPERRLRYYPAPRMSRGEIADLRARVVLPRRGRSAVAARRSTGAYHAAPARPRPASPAPPRVVAATGPTASAVYLLLHATEPRFKLGWSLEPGRRIAKLPEFRADALDLAGSRVVWLPDRQRAEEVERSMHKLLRPFSVELEYRGDGHTEWFATTAWDRAVELLSRTPLHDDPAQVALVYTLEGALDDALPPTPPPRSVRDTWVRIDDLLRRMAACVPLQLDSAATPASGPLLRMVGLRLKWQRGLSELRTAVLDAETWQYRSSEQVYAFVQWLSYDGDDLLLQFAPLRFLETWDEELHLPTQVLALLQSLTAQSAARLEVEHRLDG